MKKQNHSIAKTGTDPADILKIRATRLAQPKGAGASESNAVKVLVFRLAHETYGIELAHIRMIHPVKELTYIPGIPDFILGIINMRGEIISIVDFKKLFDLPMSEPGRTLQVIILHSEEVEFGLQADQVLDVREISESEIQTSLPTLTGVRSQYLKGVTADGLVILDGEKILSDKNMMIQTEETG